MLSVEDVGSCLADIVPVEGGSGLFDLSLIDPFTGRTDTTGPLNFDASASEVTSTLALGILSLACKNKMCGRPTLKLDRGPGETADVRGNSGARAAAQTVTGRI